VPFRSTGTEFNIFVLNNVGVMSVFRIDLNRFKVDVHLKIIDKIIGVNARLLNHLTILLEHNARGVTILHFSEINNVLRVFYYEKEELILTRFTIFEETMKLCVWRKIKCTEVLLTRSKFDNFILFASLLLKAKDFYRGIISNEQVLLTKTDMSVSVILENVLNLGACDLSVLDLDDIEPTGVVLSLIKLKHEVLIENVPTHDIIYLIS
jgi:hypothetical protein